jgi:predicted phosphodiesterase
MRIFCSLLVLLTATWLNAQHVRRFMVAGDTHPYSPSPNFSQTLLYEITLAAIREQVDFIFFTGDLILGGFNSQSEEDSALKDWRFVLDTLHHHNIKVFACRGNNDLSSLEAWDSLFSGSYLFPQNGPENEKNITYAIEYDNLLFIVMDQYTAFHKINQVWLDELLETTNREFIFVAGHEPAFKLVNTNCLAVYPEERNLFWESLINAGVEAYFCGHDHFYDHAVIDDGDGNSYNDVHQVIAGTGGASLFNDSEYNGNNGRWIPERLFHEKDNGYVLVEAGDSEVRMNWKYRVEQNIYAFGGDSYTFSKSSTNNISLIPGPDFLQNYPNPFISKTIISYHLLVQSDVCLSVNDLVGQKIITLEKERLQAGTYEVEWDAEGMSPGIYICELQAGHNKQLMKMIILK